MKRLVAFFSILFPTMSLAIPTPLADTPSLGLERPVSGETDYVDRLNKNADTLDAAILDKRVGGTVAGDLTVTGSILGDATFLTGIPAGTVFLFEDLTSQVNGTQTLFNLSTAPASGSLHVVMDGLTQRRNVDFTQGLTSFTMTIAPANDTSALVVYYATAAAAGAGSGGTLSVDAPLLGLGSIGNHLRLDPSSVTLLGPTIDQSEIPFAANIVQLSQVGASTASLQSQINALPNNGIADAPLLGNGSTGSHFRLDSASVTLLGPTIGSAEVEFNFAGSASKGGAATTALALNANPTDCSANQFAGSIDASGNLSCSAPVETRPFLQLSDSRNQNTNTTPITILMDTNDGQEVFNYVATSVSSNVVIPQNGVYMIIAAAQIGEATNSANWVDMWIRKNGVDIANSNVRNSISSALDTKVVVAQVAIRLVVNDVITVAAASDGTGGTPGLKVINPAGEPRIPSIIFTIYKLGD